MTRAVIPWTVCYDPTATATTPISPHLAMRIPILSLGIVLGSLSAQASYTVYGSSCGGSCDSSNAGATALKNLSQNSNLFCIRVVNGPAPQVVKGFALLTRTTPNTSPFTLKCQVYGADSAGKPGSVLATGDMAITATLAMQKMTNFKTANGASLLQIPANATYFLSYTSQAGRMFFPIAASGTARFHYLRSPTGTSWSGPFNSQPWAFRVDCSNRIPPRLTNSGVPGLGASFSVDLVGAKPASGVVLALGTSDKAWSGMPLPLTLPGSTCQLLCSLEFVFPLRTDQNGAAAMRFTVPNDNALKGFTFFNQFASEEVGASPLDLAFSNAGKGVIH